MKHSLFAVLIICAEYRAAASDIVRSFELKELLDRPWKRQLISFPVTADRGEWDPDNVRIRQGGEWVTFQLGEKALWEDGSLKSATLWLMANLEPRETAVWEAAVPVDNTLLPPVTTDLSIRRSEEAVILKTAYLEAALFEGEQTYRKPVDASQVSAPIGWMRLADGTVFAGSEMYGEDKIKSVSAQLTERGPLLAEMVYRYEYANGNSLDVTARLAAGDNALLWDTDVKLDRPDSGWRIVINQQLPPLFFPVRIEAFSKRDCVAKGKRAPFRWNYPVRDLQVLPLSAHEAGKVTALTPWRDWWDDYTQTSFSLWMPDKELGISFAARDPGAWVVPKPPGTMCSHARVQPKMMPLRKLKDGRLVLNVNLAAGEAGGIRRWTLGLRPMPKKAVEAENVLKLLNAKILGRGGPVPRISRRLNTVKDYVLEWPRNTDAPHPRLFLSQEDINSYRKRFKPDPELLKSAQGAWDTEFSRPSYRDSKVLASWLVTGNDELAEKGKLVERLKNHLGRLGGFDQMRHTIVVATLYDALIDSHLVSAEDRPYLRAQMAYLAYAVADPRNWSIERGYCSGNPNMSVSQVMNIGIVASLFRNHPMAEKWAQTAVNRFNIWMERDVGPNGEWRESHNYVHVSTDPLLAFATAAQRAGFADFFSQGKFRNLLIYIGKMVYTPPDPQRDGHRVTAPMGRRTSGLPWGLTGMAAKATAELDPEFSKIMQFVWEGTGYSRNITDARWGGFQHVFADPDLPAANPGWHSERFPWWGIVMRQGYGSVNEHYVTITMPETFVGGYPSGYASIVKYFSRGIPVGGTFAGTVHMHPNMAPRQELLQNRVTLARDWTDTADWYKRFGRKHSLRDSSFAALPRMDYLNADMRMTEDYELWPHVQKKKLPRNLPTWPPVEKRGKTPLDWQRQLLFVKDSDAAGFSYLVFRDTVRGEQPTMWQFWTLSRKIGTPEQTADLESFLADAPGASSAAWRELE
ncbi:MAG: hypothetical protein K9N51_13255, partial [Candidatus Pacebacteria bacterium]|nr:hypothetical protein [Candidatus Paceibacterota bacterium]